MVNDVTKAEAEILTILLPISIALSILPECSIISATIFALLLPSSIKARILMLLTVVNAVSADEKNADKTSSKIIKIICEILSVSKKSTPSYTYYFNDNTKNYPICQEVQPCKIMGHNV